jgi:hypothetical protein
MADLNMVAREVDHHLENLYPIASVSSTDG